MLERIDSNVGTNVELGWGFEDMVRPDQCQKPPMESSKWGMQAKMERRRSAMRALTRMSKRFDPIEDDTAMLPCPVQNKKCGRVDYGFGVAPNTTPCRHNGTKQV